MRPAGFGSLPRKGRMGRLKLEDKENFNEALHRHSSLRTARRFRLGSDRGPRPHPGNATPLRRRRPAGRLRGRTALRPGSHRFREPLILSGSSLPQRIRTMPKQPNDLIAPWSLHFHRDGTEDVAIICDADGDELARSRHFWLLEGDDAIP